MVPARFGGDISNRALLFSKGLTCWWGCLINPCLRHPPAWSRLSNNLLLPFQPSPLFHLQLALKSPFFQVAPGAQELFAFSAVSTLLTPW